MQASDAFNGTGTELVVIYQLSWSTGGDGMVVRSGKNLKNIKNVGLQLYGPHMDYASNLFSNSNRLNDINFKWLSQLTFSDMVGGKIVDPITAFQEDNSMDAVMSIIPDALLLTSNGNVGNGSDGSVKGSKILLTTKTASRVISDVYAVRKDYYDANKATVEKFVKSLFHGEEQLKELLKNKKNKQAEYRSLMSKSAELLMGSSQLVADTEALLGDCEFAGLHGNYTFFTGKGTTRNFDKLTSEIQTSFISMNLMASKTKLHKSSWNYNSFGLNSSVDQKQKPKFDKAKAQQVIENKIEAEITSWEEEGTLFVVEINFGPNQSEFDINNYKDDFKKALEISETNAGALVIIEGHSDPLGIMKAEKALNSGKPTHTLDEINQMKQKVKSLSFERAESVRDSFLKYCKSLNIDIDESQFLPVGMGTKTPKFSPPKTKAEWNANRRVVFRIKQVEAELDTFVPLD